LRPHGAILSNKGAERPDEEGMSGREVRMQLLGEIMDQQTERRSGWSWWYLLLLVQFVFLLWPSYYNKVEPALAGIPFFYWYQMLWVIISAILIAIVYFATED
jgi:hypothetical protein